MNAMIADIPSNLVALPAHECCLFIPVHFCCPGGRPGGGRDIAPLFICTPHTSDEKLFGVRLLFSPELQGFELSASERGGQEELVSLFGLDFVNDIR